MSQIFLINIFPRETCEILEKSKEFFDWIFLLNFGGETLPKKISKIETSLGHMTKQK